MTNVSGLSSNSVSLPITGNTSNFKDSLSGAGLGNASIWDVLDKLAKLKQEAINKADQIAQTMSADDDEATKAQKQRELAKATAFIEDIQKKIEKMTETAHTTSNSRL